MSNVKLGKRPEAFAPFPVKFTMPDGTEGVIMATFKYRTRKEFGAFTDGVIEAGIEKAEADAKAEVKAQTETADAQDGDAKPVVELRGFSMAELMEKTSAANADYLLKSLVGWDVGHKLERATVEQMADELPGAIAALTQSYRAACVEGRLGN